MLTRVTKRTLWTFAVLVAMGIAVAVSPLRYLVNGWLAGEAFYAGWPRSYWIHALSDEDPRVRRRAASALIQAGQGSDEAIPALVAALEDSDAELRWGAASALGEIGRRAEFVVPALERMLSRQAASDRVHAALAIGLFGPDAKTAVPQLLERLGDQTPNSRSQIAWALGRIGPDASAALSKLKDITQDSTPVESGRPFVNTVGQMACAAVWNIDPTYAMNEGIPRVIFPCDRFGMDRRL